MHNESITVKEQNLKGEKSVMAMQCKVSKEGWMDKDSGVCVVVRTTDSQR